MILQLRRVHATLGIVGRVLVQVRHEDGLAVRGLDVLAGAAIAVAAGADFEVEGAVYFIELGAEDGGEEGGHCCGGYGESGDGRLLEVGEVELLDGVAKLRRVGSVAFTVWCGVTWMCITQRD